MSHERLIIKLLPPFYERRRSLENISFRQQLPTQSFHSSFIFFTVVMSGKRKQHPSDSSEDERDVDKSSADQCFHVTSSVPEPESDSSGGDNKMDLDSEIQGDETRMYVVQAEGIDQLSPNHLQNLLKDIAELVSNAVPDPEPGQDLGSRLLNFMSMQVNIKK